MKALLGVLYYFGHVFIRAVMYARVLIYEPMGVTSPPDFLKKEDEKRRRRYRVRIESPRPDRTTPQTHCTASLLE